MLKTFLSWLLRLDKPTDRAVLMVLRADHVIRPHPGTDWTMHCNRCHQSVGVYPSGQRVIKNYGLENLELVCDCCWSGAPHDLLAAEHEFSSFVPPSKP